ncbi:hypothetical protein ASPZODRAFT_134939 [Penicilliopsis zonata CBS 506.65]|uniref:TLC domain-containing protein n=1 Tax=Penicilliopsis zonata CBS 506.65 TaxID=1073090 RepID=A0A1L9SCE4_9EURO|nr:hypothetical protein ASPZODRAFT_134939 [Penicilliopsis zonata CBS 506.65]OJJ44799.1 hypothetical protein ASPZODRAFT_134939 [Penicilliopsis zonata CBS 506.65]
MARDMAASQPQSVTELNACVSSSNGRLPHKVTTFREWLLANQIGISVTIFAMLLAVQNLYPSLQPYTTPFFQLSYYNPSKGSYVQGRDDISFVISSAIAFTGIRAAAIEWIFEPLARQAGLKHKAALRVAEQGWLWVYYAFFWTYGMYLWIHSSYWKSYSAIWAEWPVRDVSGSMKWYLLVQLSFWIQQMLIIHIEKRRKDHYQMLVHHIITSTLLGSAYIYGFYNVSNVVLCLMDIVDLLLPTAKILKYLKFETSCNVAFGVFLVTWLIARHIYYPQLCWSIYKDVPTHMAYGCYSGTTAELVTTDGYPDRASYLLSPFKDINGPICMNRTVKWIFLSFLLFLQLLSIIWFGMIVRVAVGVLRTGNAEDTRSDDEEEEIKAANGNLQAVGRDGATIVTGGSAVHARGRGRVRLSEQSDRKALLGRIGCDRPT